MLQEQEYGKRMTRHSLLGAILRKVNSLININPYSKETLQRILQLSDVFTIYR